MRQTRDAIPHHDGFTNQRLSAQTLGGRKGGASNGPLLKRVSSQGISRDSKTPGVHVHEVTTAVKVELEVALSETSRFPAVLANDLAVEQKGSLESDPSSQCA